MTLYRRFDSKFFWMKFYFQGSLIQRSTKCSNKRDAATVESAFRTQLALGKLGITPKEPAPTLKKACDDFLQRVAVEHPNKRETIQQQC